MSEPHYDLDAIADAVSLAAERLRENHPDHVQTADDLSVVASRLREAARLDTTP